MTTERIEVRTDHPGDAGSDLQGGVGPEGPRRHRQLGHVDGRDGRPAKAVGDTFVVHMDREALNDFPMGLYDVTVAIITFEPDREIAWTILGQLEPPIGHIYGYRLEPAEGGHARHLVLRLVDDRARTGRTRGSSRSSPRQPCGRRSASWRARWRRACPVRWPECSAARVDVLVQPEQVVRVVPRFSVTSRSQLGP